MVITVKKLLTNKKLEQSRLVAGKKGIDKSISSTNIMDNPQSFEWLVPGDLVLTTGFVFKDDPDFQKKVIQELVDANCSALAIKPRKYFGSVPQEMIDLANNYQFPIIEIPQHLSLSQFSNIVNKEIFQLQDSIVQKTLYIHEKLTDISLAGGGSEDILKEVAFVIEDPVLLLDEEGNLLAYQDWKGSLLPFMKELIDDDKKINLKDNFFASLPKDTTDFRKSIKKVLELQNESIICRILPIKALQELLGYVLVFEIVTKLERIDYIAVEKGATIIALDILKKKEIAEATLQSQNNFFQDLISGNIQSRKDAEQMAVKHNLSRNMDNTCIVLEFTPKNNKVYLESNTLPKNRILLSIMEKIISKYVNASELSCKITPVVSVQGKRLVLIIQLLRGKSRKDTKELLEKISTLLENGLSEEFSEWGFQFGIGKVYDTLLELSQSREEAEEALRLNKELKTNKVVSHIDDYLVYELLTDISDKRLLSYFYEETIQPLDEYDQINNMNLVETLQFYIHYMGNVGEASRHLYIHRNTMNYRVDKIMNTLDMDLRDAQDFLKLQLGLYIRQLLNKN